MNIRIKTSNLIHTEMQSCDVMAVLSQFNGSLSVEIPGGRRSDGLCVSVKKSQCGFVAFCDLIYGCSPL